MARVNDVARLKHMLEAAHETQAFTRGKTRQSLEEERMLLLSLLKLLEIIGEAASRISSSRKIENSDIPWQVMTSMRNHLTHGYFEINLDIIWTTITHNIPGLILQLEELLLRLSSEQAS